MALQESLCRTASLQTQERTQARSQAELKLQVAQSIVDYILGVEYRRYATNVQASSNYAGVFFSVPLPFFSRNQGEIARVRGEQEQLAKQVVAVKAQVASEVKTAYQEMRGARELLQSIEADLFCRRAKPATIAPISTAPGRPRLSSFSMPNGFQRNNANLLRGPGRLPARGIAPQ